MIKNVIGISGFLLAFCLVIQLEAQEMVLNELEGLPVGIKIHDAAYYDGNLYVAGDEEIYKNDLLNGWSIVPLSGDLKIKNSDYGETFDVNSYGQFITRLMPDSSCTVCPDYFSTSDSDFNFTNLIEIDPGTLDYQGGRIFYLARDTAIIVGSPCFDDPFDLSLYSTDGGLTWEEISASRCLENNSDFIRIGNTIHWYGNFGYCGSISGPEAWLYGLHQFNMNSSEMSHTTSEEISDITGAPYNTISYSFIEDNGDIIYTASGFKGYKSSIYDNDTFEEIGGGPSGAIRKGFNDEGYFLLNNYYVPETQELFGRLFYRIAHEDNFVEVQTNISELDPINDIILTNNGELIIVTESKIYHSSEIIMYDQNFKGALFIDTNDNCAHDTDDKRFPDRFFQLKYDDSRIVNLYTTDGLYDFPVATGQGVVEIPNVDNDLWNICTEDLDFDISVPGEYLKDIGYEAVKDCYHTEIYNSGTRYGKCFESIHYIRLVNDGTLVSETNMLRLQLPEELIFKSVSVPFLDNGDGSYSLEIPALDLFEELNIELIVEVDCMAELDKEVCMDLSFEINNSCYQSTNHKTFCAIILGSYDPNQMSVFSSFSKPQVHFAKVDSQFYQIDFQNTGNFAAKTVRLETQISEDLDITTFKFLGSSHNAEIRFLNERKLVVTFDNINLPDSTTNLLESQGHFKYRIEPIDDVEENTQIFSHADIYFDFNPPIKTNEALAWVDRLIATSETPDIDFNCVPSLTSSWISLEGLVEREEYQYQLVNANGLQIKTGIVSTLNKDLDLSNFPEGLYFLKLASKEGGSGVVKVVKAH